MFVKTIYAVKTAFRNIKSNLLLSLVTTTTIAISFIICLLFLIIFLNLSAFKKSWVDQIQIVLYFSDGTPAAAIDSAKQTIAAYDEVSSVRFVSSDAALEVLKQALRDQDGILEGLSENPLPPSLEIKLAPRHLTSEGIERFVSRLEGIPHAQDIEYGQKWLDRFMAIFDMLTITGLVLGVFLLLFTYFIISNTIKLMVYSRRDEIEIMKLVGATNLFIQCPFWIEGALQGFSGALAALVFVFVTVKFILERLIDSIQFYLGANSFIFLDTHHSLAVLALGASLGFIGSIFSLKALGEFQS